MIKIKILGHDVIIKFIHKDIEKEILIKNGNYEGRKYSHIIICDKKVFLEGDKLTLLRNDFDALLFQIKSNVEKIAEHLGREEIFIDGLSAIKEEEKDEILKLLV